LAKKRIPVAGLFDSAGRQIQRSCSFLNKKPVLVSPYLKKRVNIVMARRGKDESGHLMFWMLCSMILFVFVSVVYSQIRPSVVAPKANNVVYSQIRPSVVANTPVTPRDFCKANHFVRQMAYDNAKFFMSLHDPTLDHVISKGILESGRYASVDELLNICAHSGTYRINCGDDRLFVEVGSAIGMVSLYAASQGMRVHAFDPIGLNVDRLTESRCLNGEAHCHGCANPLQWGPFAPKRFAIQWSLVDSARGPMRAVNSRPQNLAATAGGGGTYHAIVNVTSIGAEIGSEIEILLLTCQGFEYNALLGANDLLKNRKIKSIIWRRHPSAGGLSSVNVLGAMRTLSEQDANTAKITELLLGYGYNFYNIESKTSVPVRIPPSELADYVLRPLYNGDHPNIFSAL
jgi:hypothetical protein